MLGSGDDASSVQALGTHRHLAGNCQFYGPADGFLQGCVQDCKGFARLAPALHACAADISCGGVTYVPWENENARFELRGIVEGQGPQATPDGQISFVVEMCQDSRKGWNPDSMWPKSSHTPPSLSNQAKQRRKQGSLRHQAHQAAREERHSQEEATRAAAAAEASGSANGDHSTSALAALEARLEEESGHHASKGAASASSAASASNADENTVSGAKSSMGEALAPSESKETTFDNSGFLSLHGDHKVPTVTTEPKIEKHIKTVDEMEDDDDDDNDDNDGNSNSGGVSGPSNEVQSVEGAFENADDDDEEADLAEAEAFDAALELDKRIAEEEKEKSSSQTSGDIDPFSEPMGDSVGPEVIAERDDDPDFEVKLWTPPGLDLEDEEAVDAVGSFENGQPTIFIGIASYRDFMCSDTLERALSFAKYPERLRFGVVEQNAPIDKHCFHVERPCSEDPQQLLCKYRANIRIHKVSALQARGPTYGRYRADSLYRGEYYALQIDAHMYFVKDWDEDLVSQFQSTKNDYAVLSTYPSDANDKTITQETGTSLVSSTPIICSSSFVGTRQMTKHNSAHEFYPPKDIVTPILQIWWAAGISFSRGHRILRVPYDCCLPMIFDGEETSMAYRAWTHGYDFYTFHHSAVFHPYSRVNKPPLYWENEKTDRSAREEDLAKSQRRLRKIYGLDPQGDYFEQDIERFGLGKKRPLLKFWKLFGIDYRKNKIRDQCFASTTCALHRYLVPHLRADGKGIDYTQVRDEVNWAKVAKKGQKSQWDHGKRSSKSKLRGGDSSSAKSTPSQDGSLDDDLGDELNDAVAAMS